jgi:predicted CoA-binding protein
MASDLFTAAGNPQRQQQTQQQPQTPQEQVLAILKQQGYQITPQNQNNPNALMQMVLKSNQLYQNRLPIAQNILAQLVHKR